MKKRIIKCLKYTGIILLVFIVINLIRPTWTPDIDGENSIGELRKVNLGDTDLEVMIRGCDKYRCACIFCDGKI